MTDSDRLTFHVLRRRLLSARSAQLRAELAATEAELAASARIIRALVGPAEAAGRPHRLLVDAACRDSHRGRPGPAAAGYLLIDPSGATIAKGSASLGRRTVNCGEWEALLCGLERAVALGVAHIEARTDSLFVVEAINGRRRVGHRRHKALLSRTKQIAARFESIEIGHVRRENNGVADALARQALDGEERDQRRPETGSQPAKRVEQTAEGAEKAPESPAEALRQGDEGSRPPESESRSEQVGGPPSPAADALAQSRASEAGRPSPRRGS